MTWRVLILSMASLLSWPLLAAIRGTTVTQNSSNIERYDIYELTIGNSTNFANPWEDFIITANFTSPTGRLYTVGGFYYDTATWKVRFAPTEIGAYTWNLTTNSGSGSASGGFTATGSSHRGFLRVSTVNPYRFITEGDGKPFYAVGQDEIIIDWNKPQDGTLSNDMCYTDNPSVIDRCDHSLDSYIQVLSPGTNMIRNNGEGYKMWSSGRVNLNGSGKNEYDIFQGKVLDLYLSKIHAVDWKYLHTFAAAPDQTIANSWNLSCTGCLASVQNFHTYIVNRYSAYVDVWEVSNERDPTKQYIDTITTYVKSIDPYQHPFTNSNVPPPPQPNLQFLSPHHYSSLNNTGLDNDLVNGTYGVANVRKGYPPQPMILGEVGNACPANANDTLGERYRINLWTYFFNNASPLFWYSYDNATAPCGGSGLVNMYIGPVQRSHAIIWRNNVADFDLVAVPISITLKASGSDTIRGYAQGSSQDVGAYIIHANSHTTRLSGATITLNVPQSGMQCYWLDPATGNTSSCSVAAGSQTLTIPGFTSDIVLRIRAGGIAIPPPPPPPQPSSTVAISTGGVVEGAGFQTAPFPISGGGIVSVFGSFPGVVQQQATGFPLPTTLGNATVTFNGTPAPLLFTSDTQINLIAPAALLDATGAQVVVTAAGQSSAAATVNVAPAAPGIFIIDPTNNSGAFEHVDGSIITDARPARRKETIIMFLTGLGATTPAVADGQAASPTTVSSTIVAPVVTVGGTPATVRFSGLAPGFSGLYQINFDVPSTAFGSAAVVVTAAGLTSNSVRLAMEL